jgi:hypothetical protein
VAFIKRIFSFFFFEGVVFPWWKKKNYFFLFFRLSLSVGVLMNVCRGPESFLLHWRLTIVRERKSLVHCSLRVRSRGIWREQERHGRASTKANYRKKWAQSAGHFCLADDVCLDSLSLCHFLFFFPGHSTRWLSLMQKSCFVSSSLFLGSCMSLSGGQGNFANRKSNLGISVWTINCPGSRHIPGNHKWRHELWKGKQMNRKKANLIHQIKENRKNMSFT